MEIELGKNSENVENTNCETTVFLEEFNKENVIEEQNFIPYVLVNRNEMDRKNDILSPKNLTLPQVKPDPKKVERTGWRRYIGILAALMSCLLFSLCILIVKYLGKKIGPASFGVYRFAGVMLSVPVLLYYRFVKKAKVFQPIWPLNLENPEKIKTAILLLLRGLTGGTAILLQYFSIGYIPIATATTITFSTPIFVGLTAWIFLGEKCGIVPTLAALITLSGVIVTACFVPDENGVGEASSYKDHLIGGGLAFLSMIFATSVFIILRSLRRVHFSIVTSAFGILGLTQSIILCAVMGRFDVPDSLWEWTLVSAVAIFTLLSQTLMTMALKFEDAGPIALVRTADVVFSFVWQYIFLGVDPDIYTSLGALIVCFGVGLTAFRKYITTLLPEHPRRKTFSFMLK